MSAPTVYLNYKVNLYAAFTVRLFFFTAVIYNCRKDIITFCQVGDGRQTNALKVIFSELHLFSRTKGWEFCEYLITTEENVLFCATTNTWGGR